MKWNQGELTQVRTELVSDQEFVSNDCAQFGTCVKLQHTEG